MPNNEDTNIINAFNSAITELERLKNLAQNKSVIKMIENLIDDNKEALSYYL